MNARIQELIAQCTTNTSDMVYDGADSYMQDVEYFDKELFAELIVSEAVAKIQSVGYKSSNDIPFDTTDLFVRQVKQHFGVEL